MLLGIPGDNTYSNYAEAQRAFWRQTVLPLVNRMTQGISKWLSPAYGSALHIKPDLDQVEALNPEREALWTRLNAATFLTDDEKRAAAGYGAKGEAPASAKYRDDQPRVPSGSGRESGRWTDGGGDVPDDGPVRIANADSENLRARIGGNGPPLESGTFLGKVGAGLGRYVFGPLGALISMTEPLGNGEVISSFAGKKSEGILETTEGAYYLISGRQGPASKMGGKGSGFDNYTKTHVEGHAAALMRQLGVTEARVYVNNPRICTPCTNLLPRMLPPGAKLEVITPNGSQTFAGRILP